MDAHQTILAVDETAVTSTPTWALLSGLVGLLASMAMSAFALVFSRKEKSDDRIVSMAAEIANLREQAVLSEVKAMRAEINATLAAMQASNARHDDEISELRRENRTLADRLAIIDAALRKGGLLGP